MSESKFNQRFRRELAEFNYKFFRIESHATAPGCPDNHYLCAGVSGWLEMKQETRFPTGIAYQPAQVPWLLSYWKDGGNCGTILHIVSADTLLLVRGCDSLVASRDVGKVAQIVALWQGYPWEKVEGWIRSLSQRPYRPGNV